MKTSRFNSYHGVKEYIEEASDVDSFGQDFQRESFLATASESRLRFGFGESPCPIKNEETTTFTRKFKKHIDGVPVNNLSLNADFAANSKNSTEHITKACTREYIKADVKCQPVETTSKTALSPKKDKKPFVPRRSERLAQVRMQRLTGSSCWPVMYDLPDGNVRVAVGQENSQNIETMNGQKSSNKKAAKTAATMKNARAPKPVASTKSSSELKKGSTAAQKKAMKVEESVSTYKETSERAHVRNPLKMIKVGLKKKVSTPPLRMLPTKRIYGKQRVNIDDLAPAPEQLPARRYPSRITGAPHTPMTRCNSRSTKKLQTRVVPTKQEFPLCPVVCEQDSSGVVVIPDSQSSSGIGPTWLNLSQNYTIQALTQCDPPIFPNSQAITVDESQDFPGFMNTPALSDVDMALCESAPKDVACQTLSLEHASRKSMMPGTNKKTQWNGANLPPLSWVLVDTRK